MTSFGLMTAPSQVTYRDVLRVWQDADALGVFDHAWLYDHLSARVRTLIVATRWASRTTTLRPTLGPASRTPTAAPDGPVDPDRSAR